MPRPSITRRDFVRRSVLTAGALALPAIASSPMYGKDAPSERIHLAMMGTGLRGNTVMRGFMRYRDARFLAACDPFRDRREKAKTVFEAKYGKNTVQACADYREVMERKDIDAIVCCSCDHWHIPLAVAAARSGKDMYIEKPLGPSLAWAKVLRKEVKRSARVFQYGTQQRSGGAFRHAVELVRNGYLGKIQHIDAWCVDGTRARDWFKPESTIPEEVPENLSYDLWQGPAPLEPYNHYRVHREGSFHIYDYSIGFLGGWGAHPLDIAQWGMKADGTSPVYYEGRGRLPETRGLYSTVYDWEVRANYADGVKLHFMSQRTAEFVAKKYRKRWSDHGTTFFGTKGWISVDRRGLEASDPELLNIELRSDEEHLLRSEGHDRNFLDCMKSREMPLSPLEAAIRSDTISHLSDIAIRTGRPIRWNPVSETIIDDDAADKMLCRPMRSPYDICT